MIQINELNPIYQDLKIEESKARIQVGTLQVQLAEYKQQLAELQDSIDMIPQVEADLAKLNRDYDITRERYLALVERRESARMAQKVEQNNSELIFRVVDAPVVPLLPSGPNRPLFLSGAFWRRWVPVLAGASSASCCTRRLSITSRCRK